MVHGVAILSLMMMLGVACIQGYQLKNIKADPYSLEVIKLLKDAFSTFLKRLWSSTLQMLVYTALVLFLFSLYFQKTLSLSSIVAFFAGGIIMAYTANIQLSLPLYLLPKFLMKSKTYFKESLTFHYQVSSMIGFICIGLILLGLVICDMFAGQETSIAYGFGMMCTCFFQRIGGGLYKASTGISSDILPQLIEDIDTVDRRSSSSILAISGDYIAKVIGFGSDLMGSFVLTVVASFLLSLAYKDPVLAETLRDLPLWVMSIGILSSLLVYGASHIRLRYPNIDNFLLEGLYLSLGVSGIGTCVILHYLNVSIDQTSSLYPFWGYLMGLLGAICISFTSEYLTSTKFSHTQKMAYEAEKGSVLGFFNGHSLSLKSNSFYLLYLILMIIPSFYFAGFYGIAMACMGMLSASSTIIGITIFPALSQFNTSILTLSKEQDLSIPMQHNHKIGQIGHTTIAIGNGFASGAAVMVTLGIFFSFMTHFQLSSLFLLDIYWFIGMLIGMMLPFVCSGFLIHHLIKLIHQCLYETQRQLKEIPFLKDNKAKPDIRKSGDAHSRTSMDALIIPGIMMGLTPILIGFVFGNKMLLGVVLGAFLVSVAQMFYWANFGDSAHQARRYIQGGHAGGEGAYSEQQWMTVDNIGSAYTDVLNPSLNIFIKAIVMTAAFILLK